MKANRDAITHNLQSLEISIEERKQRRYEKLSKEGQFYDRNKIMECWNEGLSNIEITKIIGCSRSVVEATLNQNNISLEERKQRHLEYTQRNLSTLNRKKVVQLTLDGKYIQIFNSIADANRSLGKASNASNIGQVCKGNRNYAYGFKWKYLTDYLEQNNLD